MRRSLIVGLALLVLGLAALVICIIVASSAVVKSVDETAGKAILQGVLEQYREAGECLIYIALAKDNRPPTIPSSIVPD